MKSSPYPLGIQSFPELRKRGCIYVDKTNFVYELASTNKYYFLSRPRRFGKSLLISTIEQYFLGCRQLFEGLAISELQPGEWPEHPVLHFDFSRQSYNNSDDLGVILNVMLEEFEEIYGHKQSEKTFDTRFGGIIDRAYEKTGRQVVVLIDEYDLPIINCIGNPELEEHNCNVLKGFYGIMKSRDVKLRFVFLTGVGKLGHLSVFSGLNNILDITLSPKYAEICGISEREVYEFFDDGVRQLADTKGWTPQQAYAELKNRYDGYHFAANLKDVYNPYSLLTCLANEKISNYWFQSGTPSHLLQVLKNSEIRVSDFEGVKIDEDALQSADVIRYKPVPFMFYTGYLTIKGYDERRGIYSLGYPNTEVKNGFVSILFPSLLNRDSQETKNLVLKLTDALEEDKIEDFLQTMKVFFAGIPYELSGRNEFFYQNVMYCVTALMGFYVQTEYRTSRGRIDMVVKTSSTIYVMEFKHGRSAEEAMRQIDDRGYTIPFAMDGRQVVKVAADFSPETRTLASWSVERL